MKKKLSESVQFQEFPLKISNSNEEEAIRKCSVSRVSFKNKPILYRCRGVKNCYFVQSRQFRTDNRNN